MKLTYPPAHLALQREGLLYLKLNLPRDHSSSQKLGPLDLPILLPLRAFLPLSPPQHSLLQMLFLLPQECVSGLSIYFHLQPT